MRMRRTAAVLAAAVAAVTLPGPVASAAPLGTLTLTPAAGTVDASPMLTAAAASTACPAGYGTNAGLRVGRAGAPLSGYVALARVADDGGYDTAPPVLAANRSLRAAFGGTPVADGGYTVVVLCTGESAGDHPDVFSTGIVVTGGTWAVATTGPTAGPTTGPTDGGGTRQTLRTEIRAAATSAPPPGGTAGGGLPRTGSPVLSIAVLGLGLVGAGVLIVRAVRRRWPA